MNNNIEEAIEKLKRRERALHPIKVNRHTFIFVPTRHRTETNKRKCNNIKRK